MSFVLFPGWSSLGEITNILNSRALGEMFDCGKTQIGKILKLKDSLLSMNESNASGSRVHIDLSVLRRLQTSRVSEYEEINKSYEWYTLACSKNIFPM